MGRSEAAAGELVTNQVRLGARTVEYRLRRSVRSRGLRVTIDAREGLVVSVPPAARRGWTRPEQRIEAFLRERQAWVLRHVDRLARERDSARARGGARDGGLVPYRGELHRIRVVGGAIRGRRSMVERAGGEAEDELIVSLATAERRPLQRILAAWFRERAIEAIDVAVAAHAPALRVQPAVIDVRDPETRWGSASRKGRLMFSWRLVLAPSAALETVVVHELAHLRVFGHGPAFWALVAARRPTHLADRSWLRRNSHALHGALDAYPEPERGAGSHGT
ncbi:MAG TPA: SprT family zinc-dependent metalloprotease [Candidatus Dormibacteraeota bacterium]|nr:SprT family zinc-dependent metalloprotease [Candidatus Dormibacteraeota bacterium]